MGLREGDVTALEMQGAGELELFLGMMRLHAGISNQPQSHRISNESRGCNSQRLSLTPINIRFLRWQ